MKLKLNREFMVRHLGVAILLFGLGCYFAYDGFIGYPSIPAAELYRSIEKNDPPVSVNLESFKAQKIKTQYGFTILCLLAAFIVGLHLLAISRFGFEYDDTSFTYHGKRHEIKSIKKIDWSRWEKKGIVVVDGITLDAWHHIGVKEFAEKLKS